MKSKTPKTVWRGPGFVELESGFDGPGESKEQWRIAIRKDGLGSLPNHNSLEIVYDCAGGGQMVVVGKHTGIDCLTRANAELIVEAVNSHADLLRQRNALRNACRDLLASLENYGGGHAESASDARALLALCEREGV